jgi:CcmD family protein
MRDFRFLFAAWMAVWVIFFAYEISIARRVGQLREEIDRLRQQLNGR